MDCKGLPPALGATGPSSVCTVQALWHLSWESSTCSYPWVGSSLFCETSGTTNVESGLFSTGVVPGGSSLRYSLWRSHCRLTVIPGVAPAYLVNTLCPVPHLSLLLQERDASDALCAERGSSLRWWEIVSPHDKPHRRWQIAWHLLAKNPNIPPTCPLIEWLRAQFHTDSDSQTETGVSQNHSSCIPPECHGDPIWER